MHTRLRGHLRRERGEKTAPYLIVAKSTGMQLESDYNGGPWPWLQEGDLGGVSCGLGDKRQKAAVYGEH